MRSTIRPLDKMTKAYMTRLDSLTFVFKYRKMYLPSSNWIIVIFIAEEVLKHQNPHAILYFYWLSDQNVVFNKTLLATRLIQNKSFSIFLGIGSMCQCTCSQLSTAWSEWRGTDTIKLFCHNWRPFKLQLDFDQWLSGCSPRDITTHVPKILH